MLYSLVAPVTILAASVWIDSSRLEFSCIQFSCIQNRCIKVTVVRKRSRGFFSQRLSFKFEFKVPEHV